MYRLEKKIENIGSNLHFMVNYLLTEYNNEKQIKMFDLDTFNEIWCIEDENNYEFFNDNIIVSNLKFYNHLKENVFSNPLTNRAILCGFNKDGLARIGEIINFKKDVTNFNVTKQHHIFNLNTKQFIKKDIHLPDGVVKLIHQDVLVMTKEGRIFVFNYLNEQILWERDFSEEFAHEDFLRKNKWHKGSVGKVYLYKEDKIIVTVSGSTSFCFDIYMGNEIWQIGYSGWYIFQNNIAFVYAGKSLAKIDLDAGKILSNNGTYYPLPDLPPVIHKKHGEITIWASGTIMLYHEEYLWYLVNSNGFYFLVKINPDTFAYENIQEIKNTADIDFMQFYKNKLYLHDLKSNLYVYEKE